MRKLKGILLGWLYWLSARVHPRYGMYLLNRSLPFGRPVLDYLEFHLADHCNLNCAGCLHYAPFADKRFADVETVRRLAPIWKFSLNISIAFKTLSKLSKGSPCPINTTFVTFNPVSR